MPFANGGFGVEPYVVTRISTKEGKVLYERQGDGLGSVVSDTDLGAMNTLFRSVVREGTATKAQFSAFDIGGKTGTSQDYRDAWFVGFTTHYITGVWMGNDDNTPTKKVTGGSLPVLVWKDVMEEAHKGLESEPLPGRIPSAEPQVAVADEQVQQQDVVEPDPQVANQEWQPPPEPPRRKKRGFFARLFGIGDAPARRPARKGDGIY
ncbi:MAG: penicillin-binding transpeptidase domain-containing protein [Hyphomicrobiales bacterium]